MPGSFSLTCRTEVSPSPPLGWSFGTSTAITPTPPSLLRLEMSSSVEGTGAVIPEREVSPVTVEEIQQALKGEEWM